MLFDQDRPSWSIDGGDWPNRQHSRFIQSGGLSWHVQQMGTGPQLLLLHGTGAATHSFRDLAPRLAENFQVLTLDLPGHGFTAMPPGNGMSLDGMARLIGGVLTRTNFEPALVVGHSAGAAILVDMTHAAMIEPKGIIALNGALRPIRGASLFSPLAKLLFLNPLAPKLFAWRALSSQATRGLLEGTGSHIDRVGIELYERLFRKSGHVAGTLGMMANWNLDGIAGQIASLAMPLILLTAPNDRAVPPRDAVLLAASGKSVRVQALDSGGHLVHEENPERVADLIRDLAHQLGVL
ncbi:alpha/beta fold hydrolase BchO [Mesorhizobium loti]|uniref:Alpha/beta hydrolase n=1 Tax=Mesorhizobium loti R88b TaxID=935548 RepID=A0A6M7WXG8_RHILI|nr:alpha/beta fold hydrolase BchO [Mesorhizobium loti]QKD05309.1 alpha/beta hydrolase [Mesorhizobium loti R88b]